VRLTQAERDRIIAAVEALDFGTVHIKVNSAINRVRLFVEREENVRDGRPVDASDRRA
jgi:hypothetical protein